MGWADGISFRAYGVSVGVRVSDPAALGTVRALLPPGWRQSHRTEVDRLYSLSAGVAPRPGVRRFNLLYRDGGLLARSLSLDDVYDVLESDLRLYVAESSPHMVFVHAGVVGWRGKAIIIPGRSYTGKTTLVAELVRAGASYYSDEYVVLGADGRVRPYPQPLGIRTDGSPRQRRVTAAELGWKAGSRPLPVGAVVVTSYRPQSTWRPRDLTPGRGVLELLSNTVPARRDPQRVLDVLRVATVGARVLGGRRGEARDAAQRLLSALV